MRIGVLDPGDQKILKDWYNSLTDKGDLNWKVNTDLCAQSLPEIKCSTALSPQRLRTLYVSFFVLFPFCLKIYEY